MQRRTKIQLLLRQKSTYRFYIASVGFILVYFCAYLYFQIGDPNKVTATPVAGDYRTIANGNFNSVGIWQRYNGSAWTAAPSVPNSISNLITIQGNSVMINSNITLDQLIIDSGAVVTINPGTTVTIANGTATDLINNGNVDIKGTLALSAGTYSQFKSITSLKSTGTLSAGAATTANISGTFINSGGSFPTSSGIWTIASGGTYEHAMNGGTLPAATWNTGSTCLVTGVVSTVPASLNQNYDAFTWNCTAQTTSLNFNAELASVQGNFNLLSTGSSKILLDFQGNNSFLSVGGNINIQGGTLVLCTNGATTVSLASGNVNVSGGSLIFNDAGGTAYGNTSAILNIPGDLNITGGTVDVSQCTANNSSKGTGIINLSGNLNTSGTGTLTETSSASRGQLYFVKNGIQNVSLNGIISETVDIIVQSGSILNMSTHILTGKGDFNLNSGGGIIVGSPNGITQSTMLGNIQMTGTRTYSTGADYTYNATSAQNSGDGIPSQVRNLTLNNSFNCTLNASTSVSNTMTFTSGKWITNANILTLGISTSILGTMNRTNGYVIGYFRRWLNTSLASNVLFPVGTYLNYNPAIISFTTAPLIGGTIICNLTTTGFIGTIGLPLMDATDTCENIGMGYWTLTPGNGFTGGTWTTALYADGFPNVLNYSKLHLIRRSSAILPWLANGTHLSGTGSNISPIANRSGMSLWGQYGITSGSSNPLPVELLNFTVMTEYKKVKLEWTTASEINNDYFLIERSVDGTIFSSIGNVRGAGNSTVKLAYSFIDISPFIGTSYYRLRQMDFDGNSKLYPMKSVTFSDAPEEKELAIKSVFPVPFSGYFTVNYFSDTPRTFTIELIDLQGKVVYKTISEAASETNSYRFENMEELANGQYLLRMSSGKISSVKKVWKKS